LGRYGPLAVQNGKTEKKKRKNGKGKRERKTEIDNPEPIN
jgi:hypothetical protein